MESSQLSIGELKSRNFNYNLCSEHFLRNNEAFSNVLLLVTIQNLADDSGMVLQFDVNHMMADLHSCFLLVADFSSHAMIGSYHYEKVSIVELYAMRRNIKDIDK